MTGIILILFLTAITIFLGIKAFRSGAYRLSSQQTRRMVQRAIIGGVVVFVIGFSGQWLYNYITGFMPGRVNPYVQIFPMMRALTTAFIATCVGSFIGVISSGSR
jgi:hypothetical protein